MPQFFFEKEISSMTAHAKAYTTTSVAIKFLIGTARSIKDSFAD